MRVFKYVCILRIHAPRESKRPSCSHCCRIPPWWGVGPTDWRRREFFVRNAFPNDDQKALLQESVKLIVELAENR